MLVLLTTDDTRLQDLAGEKGIGRERGRETETEIGRERETDRERKIGREGRRERERKGERKKERDRGSRDVQALQAHRRVSTDAKQTLTCRLSNPRLSALPFAPITGIVN